jgi:hypothetical protein
MIYFWSKRHFYHHSNIDSVHMRNLTSIWRFSDFVSKWNSIVNGRIFNSTLNSKWQFYMRKQNMIWNYKQNWWLKMPRLSQDERNKKVGMIQACIRQNDFTSRFGVSRMTITRLMSRLRVTVYTNDRPGSGRPRKTL